MAGASVERLLGPLSPTHPLAHLADTSRFARSDFHGEAQRLLAYQRQLAPPKPGGAGAALGAGSMSARNSTAHADVAAATLVPTGATDRGESAVNKGRRPNNRSRAYSEQRQPFSARRGGGGSTARSTARIIVRPEWEEESRTIQPDFRRKSVLLTAQRRETGRWPAEARWAGNGPEFVKERYDRLGTLSNEFGDGRTLPHERRGSTTICW
mmetsp:Transcript_124529/g.248408  ORF Transcript_124529/g.248408 Transcript_124529/m.248408 type:complete len:211 (-) Transcript_124529:144-776(-)